jgi:class 3 adenylate cyclase
VLGDHHGVPAVAEEAAVLATFDGPARAARCGLAILERAAAAGLRVSVGLHTAEVARHGATVSGAGVAVVQSVADRAPIGEVWATSTLRDLAAGSGLVFESRATIDVPSLGRRVELVVAVPG